ncbi:MAG: MBL fold metallo-hydrolase [Lachnospiraceae bacterium]|nr:MBL fold metallo-hydrolase [Lachnospiraceae bacterium]
MVFLYIIFGILGLISTVVVIGLIFIYLYPGVGKTPNSERRRVYAKITSHFTGKRFENSDNLKLMMGKQDPKSRDAKPKVKLPVMKPCVSGEGFRTDKGCLQVSWLGHSSALINMSGKKILIDPVLTDYSSPVGFAGVKRFSQTALLPEEAGEIDILLISHDHYDHLDYQTVMRLDKHVKHYCVALGVESYLLGWGIAPERISAMNWWDKELIDDITVSSIPAHHFSGRNPFKFNSSYWCGFVIEDGSHTVYYTGDGSYTDSFKEIPKSFNIDLALIECGQYDRAWPYCHMFPEESAQAAIDIKAKWFIPVHWGAFCICNHAWDDSIKRITAEKERLRLKMATPKIGETVDYENIADYNEKWWQNLPKL